MDEEGMHIDIADAMGRGFANSVIIAALVATLVTNGRLSHEDAASLAGLAKSALDKTADVPEDAKVIADAVLRGFSQSWAKLVTRN